MHVVQGVSPASSYLMHTTHEPCTDRPVQGSCFALALHRPLACTSFAVYGTTPSRMRGHRTIERSRIDASAPSASPPPEVSQAPQLPAGRQPSAEAPEPPETETACRFFGEVPPSAPPRRQAPSPTLFCLSLSSLAVCR